MDDIDPRTGLVALTADECWEFLRSTPVGRLAVSIGGKPDIFPVNYVVEDDTIVIRTMPGIKLASALFGDSVAFEVDEINMADHSGRSVVLHGTAEEVVGTEALLHTEELKLEPWADSPKYRYLRIKPTKVSGRRVPPPE